MNTPTSRLPRRTACATCSTGQLFYLNTAPRQNVPGSPKDAEGATMAWMWSEDDRPPLTPPPHLLSPPAPQATGRTSPFASPLGAPQHRAHTREALTSSASDSALERTSTPAAQWEAQYASLPSKGFRLRNSVSSQYGSRQRVGLQFRRYLQDVKSQTDANHLGKRGLEGFRIFLKKQYGSYVAAWRALDYDRKGALAFNEFCRSCRTLGFHGNLKLLWKELDARGIGAITLSDIEPRTGHVVGTFQRVLVENYGSIHKAWAELIDLDNNGWVGEGEVIKAVDKVGLAGEIDGKELFRMLCTGPPKYGIRLLDFDPDAVRGVRTGGRRGG